MKFEKGKRTYVWPLSVTDVVVKRLVRHCHVPCCSHKYKYNYKYTHTHKDIQTMSLMTKIVQKELFSVHNMQYGADVVSLSL